MNMGLSEDDYMYLCMEIDYIIHAAAHVNLIYPYEVTVVIIKQIITINTEELAFVLQHDYIIMLCM